MANIFLTSKCNLACPYCFANEFVNKENEEITIENFKKILQFIKRDGSNHIGLLGGEPTIHSSFSDILNIIIEDKQIRRVVIYTNGLELHKFKHFWENEKFYFLINCNSPIDIGKKKFEILKSNLSMLNKIVKNRFHLGINLYSTDMDYSFIFELLKIVNHHKLRFSMSLTNNEKEEIRNIFEKELEFKPFLFKFFKDCLINEISPNNDCNSMPDCLFNIDDKKLLLELSKIGDKYNQTNPITSSHTCTPTVDILPDLTAIRCLGLSKYTRINLLDFKSIEHIKKYYTNTIDLYAKVALTSINCENCSSRIFDKCGICFTLKLKQIEIIKKFIQKNYI